MSDSEVMTLTLLAQWQQNRLERAFLRYVRRHWRNYFPHLLSQSAFNRRSRDLWGVLCRLGPRIAEATAQFLGTPPAYTVLDTVPVPLMRRPPRRAAAPVRSGSGHWGLITRLAAKVSAYTLLVHLNYLYGLPPFVHWSPFG